MNPAAKAKAKVKQRPAESAGLGVGVVVAALKLGGVNLTGDQVAALAVVVGAVPAVVTFFKARGE